LSAADIVALTHMRRSTGFGLLRAMRERGYIDRKETGGYQLGRAARQLGFAPIESTPGKVHFAGVTKGEDQALGGLEFSPDLLALIRHAAPSRPYPWRLGFANASSANPWRQALIKSVHHGGKIQERYVSEIAARDAGDDAAVQIDQISELAAQGIDALIVSATPDPANILSDKVRDLRRAGLPVVALDRRPNDPTSASVFVTASDELIGRFSALWLAEHLKGVGRIWMLPGLDQASPARRRLAAARAVFKHFPGIVIEGIRFSGWTKEGGQRAIVDLLAKHHLPPDGVWCDSGLQGHGALEVFRDRQLAIPPHTGGDINGMFRLALELKTPFCAFDYPAAMGARAVEVAVELLRGNQVPRRVEVPVPAILPRGMGTKSIRADILAERYVRWDLPNDAILSQGVALRDEKGDA